jgi:hypothetical protein
MKPLPRFFRFHFSVAFFWAQIVVGVFAAEKPASPESPSPKQLDPGWPREVTRNGIRFVYYQPQVDEWKDFRELRARLAFVLTPKDGKPIVGVEELKGRTTANVETRTVLIDNIEITAVRFPALSGDEGTEMAELLKATFPGKPLTVSLDRLITSVQASQEKAKPVPVKTDPPSILVSTEPAVLLIVQGDPVLGPIKGINLKFVLNANWDLFFDFSATPKYYLLVDKLWLSASSLEGPWSAVSKLPADFSNFPDTEGWDHVKKAVPTASAASGKIPKVFFTKEPAELIVFAGPPKYEKIEGTQLLYATNTDDWVFTDSADGQIYYLVTGRWFRAPKLEGPWTYAGDDLPEDFQRIPAHSNAGEVLASVPGTPECEDAILLAQVPVSAVVKRTEAESKVKVEYSGEPQFAPIEGTSLSYATNTSADVIKVEDKYYLGSNAVWFVSSAPTGPWKICTEVPKVIYTIPPSSPLYHVTYVTVDSSTEDEVTCSYTAGYYGAYVAGVATTGALVWGTGYYYSPYVYTGPVPIYRPYYATYGVAAGYYPNAGVYAIGGYAYGPYASAGRAAWYNPATGGYGRVYTQQTPYGGRTSAWGYNPRTDTAWTTQQGHNSYAQWGTSTATRGGETYQAGHVVTQHGSTAVAKGPDNLYAAHDGNVYKRDDNGNWSKWDNGGWQPVNPSTTNRSNENQQQNLSAQNQERNQQNQERAQQNQQNRSQDKQNPNNSAQPKPSGRQANQQAQQKRTQNNGTKRSSDELTNGLNREAAARQRGSDRTNRQQNWSNRRSQWETNRGSRNWSGGGGRGRFRD